MKIQVNGKHLDVGDSLRTHVTDAISNITDKYFDHITDATVTLSKDANRFKADIHVNVGRGILLIGSSEAADVYPAFDGAADRLARRLRKYKNKLRHHQGTDMATAAEIIAKDYTIPANDADDKEQHHEEEPLIIAEMQTIIEELTVSEAVMRLELGDLPALMFRNRKTGTMNMIFQRKDGNIGWIDPQS